MAVGKRRLGRTWAGLGAAAPAYHVTSSVGCLPDCRCATAPRCRCLRRTSPRLRAGLARPPAPRHRRPGGGARSVGTCRAPARARRRLRHRAPGAAAGRAVPAGNRAGGHRSRAIHDRGCRTGGPMTGACGLRLVPPNGCPLRRCLRLDRQHDLVRPLGRPAGGPVRMRQGTGTRRASRARRPILTPAPAHVAGRPPRKRAHPAASQPAAQRCRVPGPGLYALIIKAVTATT